MRSTVANESGCRSRGREFGPSPVPYFCGGLITTIVLIPMFQEGLLSVTSESMCMKYWFIPLNQDCPEKKCAHMAVDWGVKHQTKPNKADVSMQTYQNMSIKYL